MKVAVAGTGYVGLDGGAALAAQRGQAPDIVPGKWRR